MEDIIIVGAKTCTNCSLVKQLLDKKNISYRYIDIGDYHGTVTDEARSVINEYNLKQAPDGTFVIPYMIRISDRKVRNGPGAVQMAAKYGQD